MNTKQRLLFLLLPSCLISALSPADRRHGETRALAGRSGSRLVGHSSNQEGLLPEVKQEDGAQQRCGQTETHPGGGGGLLRPALPRLAVRKVDCCCFTTPSSPRRLCCLVGVWVTASWGHSRCASSVLFRCLFGLNIELLDSRLFYIKKKKTPKLFFWDLFLLPSNTSFPDCLNGVTAHFLSFFFTEFILVGHRLYRNKNSCLHHQIF